VAREIAAEGKGKFRVGGIQGRYAITAVDS